MRRLLAVAALATALFAASGCGGGSNSDNNNNAGGGTGTATPGASATAGGGGTGADNTKAVCDAAEAAVTAGMTALLTEMGNAISAGAAGDKAKADAAEAKMKTAITDMVAKLRAEAGKANKAELKSALETTATALSQIDTSNIENLDESKIDQAGAELEKICGA